MKLSYKVGPTDIHYIQDLHYNKMNMLETQSGLHLMNGEESYGQPMFSLVFIYVLQLQNCNCVCSIELFENNFMYWDILLLLFLYWIVSTYLNLKLCFDS